MNDLIYLNSKGPLTKLIKDKNINNFYELIEYLKQLPYKRTSDRSDLSLVIKEQGGTCSSKHAFLKSIADENQIKNLSLFLCIFKMNVENTPKIKHILEKYNLSYIPEAHCYIQFQEKDLDITFKDSDINTLKPYILLKEDIMANQVVDYKIQFHKAYMKQWIKKHHINYTELELWNIREQCIMQL